MKNFRVVVKSKTAPENKNVIWMEEDLYNSDLYDIKIYNGHSWVSIDQCEYLQLAQETGNNPNITMSQQAITEALNSVKNANKGLDINLWYDNIEYDGKSTYPVTIHWNIQGYADNNIKYLYLYVNDTEYKVDSNVKNETLSVKENDIIKIKIIDQKDDEYSKSLTIRFTYPVFLKIQYNEGESILVDKIVKNTIIEYHNEVIDFEKSGQLIIEYPKTRKLLKCSSYGFDIPLQKNGCMYYDTEYYKAVSYNIQKGEFKNLYVKLE